eukprot:331821-Chlamydomonas_euryale.AAC.1
MERRRRQPFAHDLSSAAAIWSCALCWPRLEAWKRRHAAGRGGGKSRGQRCMLLLHVAGSALLQLVERRMLLQLAACGVLFCDDVCVFACCSAGTCVAACSMAHAACRCIL